MHFSKKINEFIDWHEIPPKRMRILNPFGGRPKPVCFSGTFSVYKNENPTFEMHELERVTDLNYLIWYYPGTLCAPTILFEIPVINGKKVQIKTRVDGTSENRKWANTNQCISCISNFRFYSLNTKNSSSLFIYGGYQIFGIMDNWIEYFLFSEKKWTQHPAGVVVQLLDNSIKDNAHLVYKDKIINS
jgi:hypothetical protein